jgi:hypothetical protein
MMKNRREKTAQTNVNADLIKFQFLKAHKTKKKLSFLLPPKIFIFPLRRNDEAIKSLYMSVYDSFCAHC